MSLSAQQQRYLVGLGRSAVVHVAAGNEAIANSLIFRSPQLIEKVDPFFFLVRVTQAGRRAITSFADDDATYGSGGSKR